MNVGETRAVTDVQPLRSERELKAGIFHINASRSRCACLRHIFSASTSFALAAAENPGCFVICPQIGCNYMSTVVSTMSVKNAKEPITRRCFP